MNRTNIRSTLIWTISIFAITYVAIFYNLDKPAIRIWDEAIYANNALEMAMHKNYLVLMNNGEASLYNTKPPLVIWFQSIFIHLSSGSTLAVRLPSALAGLFTCLLVFFFSKRHINTITGLFAVLFLVTSTGFIKTHLVRTGDLDSVLVFFITAYTLLFFDFLLKKNPATKQTLWYIYGTAFLFLAAYMTKSVAALLPLPGLFIGILLMKKTKTVLLNPHTYIAFFIVLLSLIGYYYFREQASAGYWEKVVASEFMRFNNDIMPWHNQPYWYYIRVWHDYDFVYYIWLLPLTIITLFSKNETIKKLGIISFAFCIPLFFLLSHPFIKVHWYAAPLFPIMCLLLACTLGMLYKIMSENIFNSKKGIPLAILLLIFIYPYYQIYNSNLEFLPKESLEFDGFAIRKLARYSPEINNYKVFSSFEHPAHSDPVNFYIKSLNYYNHYDLKLVNNIENIHAGDIVMTSQQDKKQLLENTFSITQIEQIHQSFLYKIDSLR